MSNTYNGWTNYATWRVNLEFFDGSEQSWTPEEAREYVEEMIEGQAVGEALSYALAFLSDVNWFEIAKHYNEEVEA